MSRENKNFIYILLICVFVITGYERFSLTETDTVRENQSTMKSDEKDEIYLPVFSITGELLTGITEEIKAYRNIFEPVKKISAVKKVEPVKKIEKIEEKKSDIDEINRRKQELLRREREEEEKRLLREKKRKEDEIKRKSIQELKKIRVFGSMRKKGKEQLFVNYKDRVYVVFVGDNIEDDVLFEEITVEGVKVRKIETGVEYVIPLN